MKLVPTYRLLFLVGLILMPLTLLQVMIAPAMVPAILLAVALGLVFIVDAYRSRGRLLDVRVILPEVIRISKDREADFKIQIENENLTIRRIRLGLSFPEEIYTPAVECKIELPEDSHSSSITLRKIPF